jgi:hypothetical protein
MKPAPAIFFALLFAISLSVSGQKNRRQTVVLNDGTWIVGVIVDDSSDYLKLGIRKPAVITLKKSDIYTYDPVKISGTNRADRSGYYIRLSTSVLAGRNSNGNTGSLSFHFSNGYHFGNGLSLGVGFGIEELDANLMPVFADIRFHPLKSRFSPFLFFKSGFGFVLDNNESETTYYYGYYPEAKGGLAFNPGGGIDLVLRSGNALNLAIGYRHQRMIFRNIDIWGGPSTAEVVSLFNRIELQFGLTFM